MDKDLEFEQVQKLVQAEFEKYATLWLNDIKAAAPFELDEALKLQIVRTLFEAFWTGIETGAEDTQTIIDRNKNNF